MDLSNSQDGDEIYALLAELETHEADRSKLIQPINSVILTRFKQYLTLDLNLNPSLTLMAGTNNSGKSSILHALAVWEFCRLATTMERGGVEGLHPSRVGVQGFGIGDDEFSPINIPSLKHMWTNLKPAKKSPGQDGYTLSIGINWTTGAGLKNLAFGLSLVNDRLFIRIDSSNLTSGDAIPRIAYLPPFAGISAHEQRVSGAVRRRRIGEGLAGAVLRNLLLEMQQENARKRANLRNASRTNVRSRIKEKDLDELRQTDPWEILQQTLREVFGAELSVSDFQEEYHSYIQVLVVKGSLIGHKLTPHKDYTKRDLMVEGSGFLQWLSVFALVTSPDVDVLLLDEPDAHLHPHLQKELIRRLDILTASTHKQVFIATHSSEILKNSTPERILEFRRDMSPRYLDGEHQKVGLLEGLGAHYAPRIDQLRRTKKVFFHEGTSDLDVLRAAARAGGRNLSEEWIPWKTERSHKERRLLWEALREEIPELVAISLRDRDEEEVKTVGPQLQDKGQAVVSGFDMRKWRRRHIESYLLYPRLLSAATGKSIDEIEEHLRVEHALVLNNTFLESYCPDTILEVRGKSILQGLRLNAVAVAKNLSNEDVCDDIQTMVDLLSTPTE